MSQSKEIDIPEEAVQKKVTDLQGKIAELQNQLVKTTDPEARKLLIDTIVEVRSVSDNLVKSVVASIKNMKNITAFSESMQEHTNNYENMLQRGLIDRMQNKHAAEEYIRKTKAGDRLRMVPKIIAILLVGIVIIMALIEMEKPDIYLPFEDWLWPSTANCELEAKQTVGGANVTALAQYTNHCVSQLNLLGYEHIGLVVGLVIFITVVGIVVWKRVKPK